VIFGWILAQYKEHYATQSDIWAPDGSLDVFSMGSSQCLNMGDHIPGDVRIYGAITMSNEVLVRA
jgi:hypothetical protein